MSKHEAYSYRAVRRGLLNMLGGPCHTREIYASPGRRRLLASARRGTLAADVAASIVSTRRRQRGTERFEQGPDAAGVDAAETPHDAGPGLPGAEDDSAHASASGEQCAGSPQVA